MPQPTKLYLIDGSSYIYRAYYAIRHLSNSKGMATNAVLGFTKMLMKIIRDEQPDRLAMIFDAKGSTFRKEMYDEYKANRSAMPDDLVPQIPLIKEVVKAFNVSSLEMQGFEADDIIATISEKFQNENIEITIVSGDKDLMQMVGDNVSMLDTMKDKRYHREGVIERFGVPPEQVVEVLGLAGDTSDNVPGVPGIGEKTATALIQEYGTIDNLLANAEQIKQKKRRENLIEFADQARLSRKLVDLERQVPVDVSLDGLALLEPDNAKLTELFTELEFHGLLQEFSATEQTTADADNYHCVLTEVELDELVAKMEAAPLISVDTETTGLEAVQVDVVGICIAIEPEQGYYIPLGHRYLGMPDQLSKDLVLEKLRPILEDATKPKIGQNLKYDMLVLRRAGIELRGVDEDTMIASYLAFPANRHKLDIIASDHLGYRMISYDEMTGTGKNRISFSEVEIEKATTYAAEDTDICLRLEPILNKGLQEAKQQSLYRDVEMPLMQVLTNMEWRGIRIDSAYLGSLSAEMQERLQILESSIHELAGRPFNIGSPKQLGEILFEEMQLPKGKKSKTGWSTDVEVLNKLAEDHDIAKQILEFRSLMKLKGTYTDALPTLVNPETGRIHTSFNQTVTATGRLSSSNPNLQNIPIRTEEGRKIREAFIPQEGWKLIAADYSQVELRVLAHIAKEKAMVQTFADGVDIHLRTASEVFGVLPMMVTDELRRRAKSINFGVVYGVTPFGLAKQLGISRSEAGEYIDSYFKRYPGIKSYMDEYMAKARETGYAETILGRRCAIPEINSKNGAARGNAERNAINYPIQGSAADIIKVAMVNIERRLQQEGFETQMLLQVHDELVFEAPEGELEAVQELIRHEMEHAVELDLPLTVDIGVGDNWRRAH